MKSNIILPFIELTFADAYRTFHKWVFGRGFRRCTWHMTRHWQRMMMSALEPVEHTVAVDRV